MSGKNKNDVIMQGHTLVTDGNSMGVDLGLGCTGMAFVNPDELMTWDLSHKDLRGPRRLLCYREEFAECLALFKPDVVVLEGYAYSKGMSAHQVGELGGLVRLMLYERGTPWYIVAPPTLKKFVTGKGVAPKNLISLSLYKRWAVTVEREDQADAAGLAFMGAYRKEVAPSGMVTVAMQEAVDKMSLGAIAPRQRRRSGR